MSALLLWGKLLFGHELIEGKRNSVYQRTIIIRDRVTRTRLKQSEIQSFNQISDLAADSDIRACILSGEVPEVADKAVTSIQNNMMLELEVQYNTLCDQMGNLAVFLAGLNHTVHRAHEVLFTARNSLPTPSEDDTEQTDIKISSHSDLHLLRQTVFTEAEIRQWLSGAVAYHEGDHCKLRGERGLAKPAAQRGHHSVEDDPKRLSFAGPIRDVGRKSRTGKARGQG